MTLATIDSALAIVAKHPDRAFFAGPRPEKLIVQAELALGGSLPPSYRRFVERLGAGSFGSAEVYGIIEEPFDGPVPDAVWITIEERERGSIPHNMIIVGDSGDGSYYCLQQGEDGPVFLLETNGNSAVAAAGFGQYLLSHFTS
ncbi:SMI1/KNR4 family protein [Brevundimonas sp. P7753]|uniref:SMI1/KNR4 family protein n=1 Tax=Brevundimonas sp. P7753 TaxID=2726982 RepID=UPI0015BEBE91|nr:SMI1/KNR4 family protein [Brevundimonas sp. P7753]NWE51496.1 SMI1/KNR4 family protein [Brevundimonas sp. P7753]